MSSCPPRYGHDDMKKIVAVGLRSANPTYRASLVAHQGRTASYPTAPSQIPACGITAPGSSKLLALHTAFP